MSKYDDIINLPHPVSKKHPRMSIYNRAAQFSPFAALTGYDDLVSETGREVNRKIELDEYEKDEINNNLQLLKDNPYTKISITYFLKDKYKEGGEYITTITKIKKFIEDKRVIILEDTNIINIEDIVMINII